MLSVFLARHLFSPALLAAWHGDAALTITLELWAIFFGKDYV